MEQPLKRRDLPLVLAFLIPGLVFLIPLLVIPIFLVVQYTFYDASSFTGAATFVGFENYTGVIGDERFWVALKNTTFYSVVTVVLQMVLGIIFALALNEAFPGRGFVRGVSIVPYILPVVVVTVAWEWILDYEQGILNHILQSVGLAKIQFLGPDMAMWTSIGLSVWAWTPFVLLVFLSGLQTVPVELYESASMDGAGPVRRFFVITLPSLRGLILTILLLRGIWMFNKLDLIYLLTGGGPLGKTETLPVYIYHLLFKTFDIGKGSTIAFFTFLIMVLVMSIYLKLTAQTPSDMSLSKRMRRVTRKKVSN